jgi:hypothetical protein
MNSFARNISRRRFIRAATATALASQLQRLTAGEAGAIDPAANIFQAPTDQAQWPAFRKALAAWRARARAEMHYDDALYREAEFAWSATNYACGFLMTCDEAFYNWRNGRYTVEAWLADSIAWCFGMPIRESAWIRGTSLISIAICRAELKARERW